MVTPQASRWSVHRTARAGPDSDRGASGIVLGPASAYHRIMRTTLTLDRDVFEAAQALARASGRRLGMVVSELMRRGLRPQQRVSARNGLPVFVVPPDAPVIPSDRAHDLLADEP